MIHKLYGPLYVQSIQEHVFLYESNFYLVLNARHLALNKNVII